MKSPFYHVSFSKKVTDTLDAAEFFFFIIDFLSFISSALLSWSLPKRSFSIIFPKNNYNKPFIGDIYEIF
jgi:hypothetical protein